MTPITPLMDPMKLAKERSFAYVETVVESITRLRHLYDNFDCVEKKTSYGLGYFKHKNAVKAKENLAPLIAFGERVKEAQVEAREIDDVQQLSRLALAYVVELTLFKKYIITAFQYDFENDAYTSRKGDENWKWVKGSLFVPELKCYGK